MNKILFKLIEGKGKFFLGMNWPIESDFIYPDPNREGKYDKDWYNQALNECISEALKNGEIVNPEVLPNVWESINKGGKFCFLSTFKELKDGDTFDLPEGMGFEEKHQYYCFGWSDCNEKEFHAWNASGQSDTRKAIRLLPEKPKQNFHDRYNKISESDNFKRDYDDKSVGDTIGTSEKPVQKEESQEDDKDDWDALGNEINKRMVLYDAFGVHPTLELIRQAKMFTIKRKDS